SFPGVLLEAGQAGVPVVAARVGGVAEIVADGQTGWLFEPGDWRQGAAILAGLVQSPRVCRSAGQAARDRVLSQFSVEGMAADYLKLYSELAR
ncbi:MAG: glycosyltransferase, partial [Verrucomicrobia bacterium]|nr:glycosyltransferase [Verrucomicrobiota bacterium]